MKMILTPTGKTLILKKSEPQPQPVLQLTNDDDCHVDWDDQDITA